MPSDLKKPTIIYPYLWDYRVIMTTKEIYCIQNASLEPMKPFKVFASEIKFGFVNRSTYSPIAIPKLFKELLSAV